MNVTAAGTEQEESFPNLADSSCVEPSGVGGFNRVYVRPDDQPKVLGYNWDECTSIIGMDEVEAVRWEIYPNPFSNFTTVSLDESGSFEISIVDLTGKEVLRMNDVNGQIQINRGNMIPGIYLINILDEKGQLYSDKLMVR